MKLRRFSPYLVALCPLLLAAHGVAGTPVEPPGVLAPLLSYSESAASGTRPLLYSTFAGPAWEAGTAALEGPFTPGPGFALHWKVALTNPDRHRQVVLFQEDDVILRDRLWASFWDGNSWSAEDGLGNAALRLPSVNDATLSTDHRVFDAAFEQESGRLLVAAGISTEESFVWWTHEGTTWSGYTMETMPNQIQGGRCHVFEWVRLAPRPHSNQVGLLAGGNACSGTTPDTFVIQGAIWDGDADTWGSKYILSWPDSSSELMTTEAMDMEFTLAGVNAGEGVAVWGGGEHVYARVWDADYGSNSGWRNVGLALDLGSGNNVRWLRLDPDPESSDMVLGIEDTNGNIYTAPYDGATRVFGSLSAAHTTAAFGSPDSNRAFDVLWDRRSGTRHALVVYSDATSLKYRTSEDGGANWGSEEELSADHQAYWVQLEREPRHSVNLAVHAAGDALLAWTWDGTSWSLRTEAALSSGLETGSARNVEAFALAPGSPSTRFDLDKDGRSDLVWRHTAGALHAWMMDGPAVSESGLLLPVDPSWQVRAIDDFNGDGHADILWRHSSSGATYVWFMRGTTVVGSGYTETHADSTWKVQGTGDFDGDGRSDILWRHTGGALYVWLMEGAVLKEGSAHLPAISLAWSVEGIGDFDGDGRGDILWRHVASGATYVWFMSGTSAVDAGYTTGSAAASWSIEGVGDLDGDGRDDILWRHTSGLLYAWLMEGLDPAAGSASMPSVDVAWQVRVVADFAGDGRCGILWRETASGATYLWRMNGAAVEPAGYTGSQADTSWTIQAP